MLSCISWSRQHSAWNEQMACGNHGWWLQYKCLCWFGLVAPSIRYVAHAADGSLKRLTNSKTMNVSEISEFVLPFHTILHHFQQSEKSTCLLMKHLESRHENCSHDVILPDKSGLSAFCMYTSSWSTFTYMWCSYISWHQKGSK